MSDDKQSNVEALASIPSDPAIRVIWEQELWSAFANRSIRERFVAETGVQLEHKSSEPIGTETQEPTGQIDPDVLAFIEWFNDRLWPALSDGLA